MSFYNRMQNYGEISSFSSAAVNATAAAPSATSPPMYTTNALTLLSDFTLSPSDYNFNSFSNGNLLASSAQYYAASPYSNNPVYPNSSIGVVNSIDTRRDTYITNSSVHNQNNVQQPQTQTQTQNSREQTCTRPAYSYISLITQAIESTEDKRMSLRQIYDHIAQHPYYQTNRSKWENSIRHSLSYNDCFVRIPRPADCPGKGALWTLHPNATNMFDNGCHLRRAKRFVAKSRKTKSKVKTCNTNQPASNEVEVGRIDKQARVVAAADSSTSTPTTTTTTTPVPQQGQNIFEHVQMHQDFLTSLVAKNGLSTAEGVIGQEYSSTISPKQNVQYRYQPYSISNMFPNETTTPPLYTGYSDNYNKRTWQDQSQLSAYNGMYCQNYPDLTNRIS